MMKQTKISIIVPVYNVEKYLDRCIRSLLNQTYEDYEIILVDDGSVDSSPIKCDLYAQKSKKIRVIHKKNGGLSDARNVGVDYAKGMYISFVDSDDYVHPDYLKELVSSLEDTNADFSAVGIKKTYSETSEINSTNNDYQIKQYNANKALSIALYQEFHDVCAVGMLLRLDLVKKIQFPKGKLFEDLYTTYKYYLISHKVTFVYADLYYYYQRRGSIMKTPNVKFLYDLVDASDALVDACQNDKMLLRAAENKIFSNYCKLLLLYPNMSETNLNVYEKILCFLKQKKIDVFFDKSTRLKNKVAAISLCFGAVGLVQIHKLQTRFQMLRDKLS